MIQPPYPELQTLLAMMGDAGRRLNEIDSVEGSAGNMSIYIGWQVDPRPLFPVAETIALPVIVPDLAGKTFVVSGSGCRLREIDGQATANVACLVVDDGGATGILYTAPERSFMRLTSEFNTHLAVHADHARISGTNFHAIVHAQPPHLTYLSHIPRYQETLSLNNALLRWQPETIIHFPEGIGCLPFQVPGSEGLMRETVTGLRSHRLIVWAKHGVVARSDNSIKHAVDLVEYAEAAARYEVMHRAAGEPDGAGLTMEEIQSICSAFGIESDVFKRNQ